MTQGPVLSSRAWERQAHLTFANYLPGDEYISKYTVTVTAEGLTASASVITTPDGHGLPAFIHRLVDDFRGWDGTRSWRSLEDQLRIDAAWKHRGHVELLFHLTPSVEDRWTVSVEFTLDAGEELRSFGDELASFIKEL